MATEHQAPEQRTIDVDVEAIDTRGRTLHGYAAVYNLKSEDLGGFRERIAPGAFRSVLDADVRALLNHDPSQVLGRTKSGTLRLFDEQRGLRFEVDLPDSPLGENVREAVRRKDIDGASFRFQVDQESWQGDLRTVESVKQLKDITVATFGAYPAASVELRTRNNDGAEKRQKENTMTDEVRDGGLEVEDRHEKQDEQRTEERLPAGSLRVEDRTYTPASVGSMADLYAARGFFENRVAAIEWDEWRTVSWSAGTVLTDLAPIRPAHPALGYDTRWLYPALPQTGVDASTTSVQYVRQASRTLPGTAVIRPLDSVTAKPDVVSAVEYTSAQLNQVAAISKDVPRILSAQPIFQTILETDLRLSVNDGLDELCRRGLVGAGTSALVTGNVLDKIRKAVTVVQGQG
jgi:uncharacterized protein